MPCRSCNISAANVESRLFMGFRVLLTPEDPQQLRPVFEQNQGARSVYRPDYKELSATATAVEMTA